MNKKRPSKQERDFTEFFNSLGQVFDLNKALYRLRIKCPNYSSTSKQNIKRLVKKKSNPLVIYYPYKNKTSHIYHKDGFFDDLDIGMAIMPKNISYFSHLSAIYLHGLTQQVPKEFYITTENKHLKNRHGQEYNSFRIEQVFMKPPRTTKDVVVHKDTKYFLLQKTIWGNLGVIDICFTNIHKKIAVTDLERTLLDISESPHLSGGINTVLETWNQIKGSVDLVKLKKYYNSMNYFYPYWQRIGFLIENSLGKDDADIWMEFFGKPIHEFYAAREFKLEWPESKKWKIRYPKGLIE